MSAFFLLTFVIVLCTSSVVLSDLVKPHIVVLKSLGYRASARKSHLAITESSRRSFHASAVKKHGLILSELNGGFPIQHYTELLDGFSAMMTTSEAKKLKENPDVLFVTEEKLSKLYTYNSIGFLKMNATGSGIWKKSTGKNAIIGVIDTGINPSHPSFANTNMVGNKPSKFKGVCSTGSDRSFKCNRKLIGARMLGSSFAQVYGYSSLQSAISSSSVCQGEYYSTRDIQGHGTHCAGTAVGNYVRSSGVKGAAPSAHLVVYKVFWCGQGAYTGDIMAAIESGVKDGVDVLSLSLGGGADGIKADDDGAFYAAYKATLEGVSVVYAAGNAGPGYFTVSNAVPWVLTVAATTTDKTDGKNAPTVAGFSSRGPNGGSSSIIKPDIGAPGVSIYAASHIGTGYSTKSGTSMATPHIAGIVSLLRSIYPSWSPSMYFSAIMTTATQKTLNNKVINANPFLIGSGNVNPNAAVNPGLVYPLRTNNDFQPFFCSTDSGLRRYFCEQSSYTQARDLNLPSVGFYEPPLNRKTTARRIMMNVGTKGSTYTAKVVSPDGVTLTVSPTKLTFNKGQRRSYNITVQPFSATGYYEFGSITWSDNQGHSVRISVMTAV